MPVQQLFGKRLPRSSYLYEGLNTLAVVDAGGDVNLHMQVAKDAGVQVTHTWQSRLRGDFNSGQMDLAQETRAARHATEFTMCAAPHAPTFAGKQTA
ncbi:MAG: hypothetical protein JSU70_01680 [Phycisphaerales bacterium]|nr:MAG: hypothetical protein JSU70_01680 [Phycisphaerales bacterium]